MSLITFSADGFVASIFCLIVVPLKGYDEPEILPSQLARICLIGADAGHKTIQHAIDNAASLDIGIYDVTIQVGAGTYSIGTGLVARRCTGAGSIYLVGDETTPANVELAQSGAVTDKMACLRSYGCLTVYRIRGFKLTSTGTGLPVGLIASSGSIVEFQNLEIGTGLSQQLRAEDSGIILATGPYTISGGGLFHATATGSGIVRIQYVAITITGTPNYSIAFLDVRMAGVVFINTNTFTGSATGLRYNVMTNGAIQVAGAGANYLPGNATGTAATGGQYA